jgi:hypothetical protein
LSYDTVNPTWNTGRIQVSSYQSGKGELGVACEFSVTQSILSAANQVLNVSSG